MIYHSNNQFYLKSKRLKCSDGILPIFSFIQLYAFLMFLQDNRSNMTYITSFISTILFFVEVELVIWI